jgi:SpoVK/Ycf46/Vps4 family AAA+-type ATPase
MSKSKRKKDKDEILQEPPLKLPTPKISNPPVKEQKCQRPSLPLLEIKPPFKLNTIQDLLNIAWFYNDKEDSSGINFPVLWDLIEPLTELNNMIGLDQIKTDIMNMILYYIQDMHKIIYSYCEETDEITQKIEIPEDTMLHCVILGDPGTGKTVLSKILAKIYCRLGFLKTDNIVTVQRSDLIKGYIGHTEEQTRKLLEQAIGGVFLIDEAYSLGDGSHTDTFSKGCINVINQFLTERSTEFVCIIAGYEKEINESLFKVNPGLKRRFPWIFKTGKYTPANLRDIFLLKVKKEGWILKDVSNSERDILNLITSNKDSFSHSGGDINTLFSKCKYAHTRRIFGTSELKKTLTIEDINTGFDEFIKINGVKKEEIEESYKRMYI